MSEPNNTPKSLQTLLAKNGLKSGKLSATSGTPTGSGGALDHETKLLVNMIFARFHHIYTHKFESAYGDESTLALAKREWAYSLAGTPAHLVEYALERCKLEFAWPPTIADFVQLLQPQPEALGLPGIRDAYLEACQNSHSPANRRWSHAAVHLAARDVGFFRMRTEAERHSWPPFEKAYQERVNQVARGDELEVSEPAIALPDPDTSAELSLVNTLEQAGVEAPVAYKLAYYLEKPPGSEVRERYREHSRQRLDELGVTVTLPA
ncbi:replication protein P [Saccharospirillum alexandrii]|uniref:replication protein P n=1 Tax=Saccharospirillum alexandrii TaxID=2448477 RepID=UPI000FD825FB|nr:replication protein P [Saccharospirillum alexandrii]